ncbi:MAG TPA: RNA methyltransferase [Chloroflexota bacterium]|nr:RNA methyltransferase [Chloroflexota bacterium]
MPDDKRPHYEGPTITSAANERIRFVRSLQRTNVRRKEGLFVVEGVRLVEEALTSGAKPRFVLVVPEQLERTPRGRQLLEQLGQFHCQSVTEPVLKALSDTVTPQGVVAVLPVLPASAEKLTGPVALVLDHVRDPGNAGTLLRSADASGVVRTVVFVDSVDAYSPKVVRAAMGAHFRLSILEDIGWDQLSPRLADRPRWLASAHHGVPYDQVDWQRDSAIILGGEAEGAGPEAEAAASDAVTIPMAGPVESLNAAMAGTILLFDVARVRRGQGEKGK